MSYAYFDYAVPERDMIASDMKLAALYKKALDDGWDMTAPLLLAHRTRGYTYTIRLSRQLADDILDTWAERGWSIEPLPDWIRDRLAQIFVRSEP